MRPLMAVITTTASIAVEDGAIPLTVCAPDGDERLPTLLVIPSIFGVHDDLIANMAELAEGGALVVAMDPFWRVMPGPVPYEDMPTAFARVGDYDRTTGQEDVEAAIAHCRAHPRNSGKVAALGICFGGPWCFVMAAAGELDGIVCWHGSRLENYSALAPKITCPAKLHFGAEDPISPPETIAALRGAFAGRPDVDIVVHPGATHGYSHEGDAYQDSAAKAGMSAARELLAAL